MAKICAIASHVKHSVAATHGRLRYTGHFCQGYAEEQLRVAKKPHVRPSPSRANRERDAGKEPAAKPVSLAPLSFERALGGLLRVKPKKKADRS